MGDSIRNIIAEEFSKVFEDYDYAAAEREHADQEYYNQTLEAEVSAALSFMQDAQGSKNKLNNQKSLDGTSPEVDKHIDLALEHIEHAIQIYIKTLSPEAKTEMIDRMGEINIEK